jgi:hypothetical protein
MFPCCLSFFVVCDWMQYNSCLFKWVIIISCQVITKYGSRKAQTTTNRRFIPIFNTHSWNDFYLLILSPSLPNHEFHQYHSSSRTIYNITQHCKQNNFCIALLCLNEISLTFNQISPRNPKKNILRTGFEPVTYGLLFYITLQSTALPTELSKVHIYRCIVCLIVL